MKTKLLTLGLICFSLVAAGCSCSPTAEYRKREDEGEKVDPIPEEKGKKVSELTEAEYAQFPTYYLSKLNTYQSYKSVTKGNTHAVVTIIVEIPTDQSIDVTAIKGKEYSYLKNESHSSFVNTVHTAYYKGQDVDYSQDGGDYQKNTLEEYLNTFGTYPLDNAIEGYKVTGDAIKSISKLESTTDYKFKLEMDPEKSTNNVRIQMRKFGGLDDYPVFENISMTITVKDDFTPVTIELDSNYTAKKGMESKCHQTYTVTFSDFNQDIEIPDLDSVKDRF